MMLQNAMERTRFQIKDDQARQPGVGQVAVAPIEVDVID
jgi:hypothetical protein